MKRKIIATILFVGVFFPIFINAQEYKATAKLDTNHILIGDYLNIHLEVTAPTGKTVVIPQLNQEIFQQNDLPFDWIQNSKIDTVILASTTVFSQTITITSFDSGSYVFPSIPILSIDSQLLAQTEPLFFEVSTVAVDTTAAFKDIKGNVKIPLSLHEIMLYMKKIAPYLGLAIIIIGITTYLVVRYLNKKAKKKPVIAKPKPKIKPHIIALKALEDLRQKKLWEQGKVKEYYSELTDIIRVYMENRWDVYAMEMVSSEILEELRRIELPETLIEKMESVLTVADLVKFAKWTPLPTDHDITYKNCRSFVEKTIEKQEENNVKTEHKDI